ncbi:MAG: Putative membrane protein insertion efficiency factor [Thermoanaerobacterales bacterium 50_218]|nr:MAG: Putative membrane protein insertion efficiency factor [Thermoanaerobacterales bacterium 50_218]HAA89706.1 membrane protein insertion efficiency factor YidD [Peptococcaceae bacterium]
MTKIFILIIKLYQKFSQLRPPCCRFYPSCSDYAIVALKKYGLFKGLLLAAKRVLRCHPWSVGGYDPVP